MLALLQRVTQARVDVAGDCIAQIGAGLLVLLGVEREDSNTTADRLLERVLGYRVFPDARQRMNLSLTDVRGGLLLVPQFTLAADTAKGTRASFSSAAPVEAGREIYSYLVERAARVHSPLASGRFGADMQVHLTNDGPVTFLLRA